MAGELSFIEIGVEDADKGRVFYEALFGWDVRPAGRPGKGFVIDMAGTRGGMHPGDEGQRRTSSSRSTTWRRRDRA